MNLNLVVELGPQDPRRKSKKRKAAALHGSRSVWPTFPEATGSGSRRSSSKERVEQCIPFDERLWAPSVRPDPAKLHAPARKGRERKHILVDQCTFCQDKASSHSSKTKESNERV